MTFAPSKTPIIYPEPDGEPMAESDFTREYLFYGVTALKSHFRQREDVYVSGNLWVSYQEGIPDAAVCPDVFVVFGVEDRPRKTFRTWLENDKTPDWVLEITSASTREEDERDKPLIYAEIGVSEYFQYDPTGDYLYPPLKGQRLINGVYQSITPDILENNSLSFYSEVLKLHLQLLPKGLRFFDPQAKKYLKTFHESQKELQKKQQINQAEKELQQLRDRLFAMGLDPDNLPPTNN